jgi:hypothetical protein
MEKTYVRVWPNKGGATRPTLLTHTQMHHYRTSKSSRCLAVKILTIPPSDQPMIAIRRRSANGTVLRYSIPAATSVASALSLLMNLAPLSPDTACDHV